jgi:hypothetical protein
MYHEVTPESEVLCSSPRYADDGLSMTLPECLQASCNCIRSARPEQGFESIQLNTSIPVIFLTPKL